ncbi:hypothetical protein M011DRAFT_457689 [Sporormia fimetaria CBS 119925]|uniref:Malate dehydrogenase n=1 Tax=Sporormia fimetaria CBS 119925 TaxID=1340428 RepID=A0A6A6VCS0_9PLEO|nr:hypothetical protein M011DRAFT_457689 [Sporormia fimetaria CBS 119925]
MQLLNVFSVAAMALSTLMPSVGAVPTGQLEARYTMPNLKRLQSMMPKSGLAPPTGMNLKFVGLGIGTQNYTCLTNNQTAVPDTTGAIAKLYDLGKRLDTDPLANKKISSISGLALSFYNTPRLQDAWLKSQGYQQVLGDHFFTQKTPTFALNRVPANPFPLLFVSKKNEVDAPKSACKGLKGEGAIKWLHLVDNGSSKGGVNTVYRLETAGGNKPATCKGRVGKSWEVPYVAQYWVY